MSKAIEILTNKFIQDVKNLWELERQRVNAKEQVERNLMECEDINMIVKEVEKLKKPKKVKKVMIDDDPILPNEPQFNPVTKKMDNVKKVEKPKKVKEVKVVETPVKYSKEDYAELLIGWGRMVGYESPKDECGNRTFNNWRGATIGQMRKFIDQNGINLHYAEEYNKMERGLVKSYGKYEDVGIDREELYRRYKEHYEILGVIYHIEYYNKRCEEALCEDFILYQYNGGDPTELFRICEEYQWVSGGDYGISATMEVKESSCNSAKELLDMYYGLDEDIAKDLINEMVEDDCEKLYVIATEGTINQHLTQLSDYTIFRGKIVLRKYDSECVNWDIKKSKIAPEEFKQCCKNAYFGKWEWERNEWVVLSDEDKDKEIGKKIGSYICNDDDRNSHDNYQSRYERLRRPTIERIERYYEISVRGFVMK
jgi:hypothetical protein